jgi:hypothetical protein
MLCPLKSGEREKTKEIVVVYTKWKVMAKGELPYLGRWGEGG